jgi:biofilm PGA synthesis lipoprotein PgaB
MVDVYAWMPVLAFDLASGNPAADQIVKSADPDAAASGRYRRLSPFSPAAREVIGEIYSDLSRYARFDGLLFHDDATLDDFEDVSVSGREALAVQKFPPSIDTIRADPALLKRWTAFKSDTLIALTQELALRVRERQGVIKTARNLYALPVLDPNTESRFAQSLPAFLAAYDYTALMAMPLMEGSAKPDAWLDKLAKTVAAQPGGMERTVFELQSVDWRMHKPVPDRMLASQLVNLQRLGALNIGYYPDDFIADRPALVKIIPAMSQQTFPRSE